MAVLLTGMGRDGAAGMKKLRDRGAVTLAQSGETCVVDGMPRAARQVHAVTESIPLQDLGHRILQLSCRLSEPWRETQQ